MNIKLIFKQIKTDLIGKDSHRGVTLSYAWLCNQLSHFSLGFIPTLLIYEGFIIQNKYKDSSLLVAFYVSLFWLVFELFNLLNPLMFTKRSKYVFKPNWSNLLYDTLTDLSFFWLGALSLSLYVQENLIKWGFVVVLLLFIVFASKYWYVTKIYQDYAGYPLQIRLSQWNWPIDKEDVETVKEFLNNKELKNHLLIFGSHESRKSRLSIAMLNELSIRHNKCKYVTSDKLFSILMNEKTIPKSDEKWNCLNADYLVIDDINLRGPVDTIIEPTNFLKIIDNDSNLPNYISRFFFKDKSIVWVLGKINSVSDVNVYIRTWADMLENLGIEKERISTIILKDRGN